MGFNETLAGGHHGRNTAFHICRAAPVQHAVDHVS